MTTNNINSTCYRNISQMFQSKEVDARDSTNKIPFFGKYISKQLKNTHNIRTINEFVLHFKGKSEDEIEHDMTRMFQNRRMNQCDEGYHIRDVNRCAYESGLELLRATHRLRRSWQRYRFSRKPNTPNVPISALDNIRTKQSATCSCITNQRECRSNGCVIRRRNNRTYCNPPDISPGFLGIHGYQGQHDDGDRNKSKYGLRYVRGWRVPRKIGNRN